MDFLESLDELIAVLNNDGVILYPTDTIWGLGCHAHSDRAINKIYEIKKRNKDQPLISLVDSIAMLKETVEHVHPRIETLLEYHRKPLTVIYPKAKEQVHKFLKAKNDSVAIRLIHDPFCVSVIKALGAPLVSTSANLSGDPFPKSFNDIKPVVVDQVDYVVKYKQNIISDNAPSVLVRYDKDGNLIFLRE